MAIRLVDLLSLGALAGGVLALAWSSVVMAAEGALFAQASLPQVPTAKVLNGGSIPLLPHERDPTTWPQPDYLVAAMAVINAQADEGFRSVRVRDARVTSDAQYLVLPVQTQAFGFAPAFRAIVAAELDRQLAAIGVAASRQIDVMDASGPLVRRLDEATVRAFAAEHPAKKLIVLYIGQDGIKNAFVDLAVRDANVYTSSHQTIEIAEDPAQAFAAMAKAIPELLSQVGLLRGGALPVTDGAAFDCTDAAWDLADLPIAAAGPEQACNALAIGTLLPDYEADAVRLGRMLSPAKLARLAHAYVIARSAHQSAAAQAVRDLSLAQLEMGTPDVQPVAYISSVDPVASRIAKLLSVRDRAALNPSRSERDVTEKYLADATRGLPDYARALFVERVNFWPTFRQVDSCSIESAFPGPVMRSYCTNVESPPKPKAKRAPSSAQALLYQEWRVAASYKDLVHYGLTLGRPDRVQDVLKSMPSSVAAHPIIQRVRYRVATAVNPSAPETFDEILSRTRLEVAQFVQSTANMQTNDQWTGAYALSWHNWTKNSNIANDAQIVRSVSAERRLLDVLAFDRFTAGQFVRSRRRPAGERAYFLAAWPTDAASDAGQVSSAARAGGGVVRRSIPPALFLPHNEAFDQPSIADFETRLRSYPQNMELRARLGIAKLKEGASMAEVARLFNAHPANQRDGEAVRESNAWALPAHVLYLSGEVDAARPFYEKVRSIGSGSESDMMAGVRLSLIDGKIGDALKGAEARVSRYESDFARRDLLGLLFMTRQSARAWPAFRQHATKAEAFDFWFGAAVGHRMEGLDLPAIRTWFADNKLDRIQIDYVDVASLYLHFMAVTDRLPGNSEIELLRGLPGSRGQQDSRWAMAAILVRDTLQRRDPKETYTQIKEESAGLAESVGNDLMLPLYVWVAARANIQDKFVDQVRQTGPRADFRHTLAKSMLLAAEGKTGESLRYFEVSRYELGNLTWGQEAGLDGHRVPVQYQYALAGYLMYRETGQVAYRDAVLHFLDGYERSFPYFAWAYALQSALETDATKRTLAACRARVLDPKSYFLTQAKGIRPVCPTALW